MHYRKNKRKKISIRQKKKSTFWNNLTKTLSSPTKASCLQANTMFSLTATSASSKKRRFLLNEKKSMFWNNLTKTSPLPTKHFAVPLLKEMLSFMRKSEEIAVEGDDISKQFWRNNFPHTRKQGNASTAATSRSNFEENPLFTQESKEITAEGDNVSKQFRKKTFSKTRKRLNGDDVSR